MNSGRVLRFLLLLTLAIGVAVGKGSAANSKSAPSSVPATTAADTGSALVFEWAAGASVHDPVSLTNGNFFDLVLDSRQAWLVAFVAPWCGHCRALHAPFAEASRALKSTVRLGVVDATQQKELAGQFRINSYPTILTFPAGRKTPQSMQKYSGGREKVALVAHARTLLSLSNMRKLSSAHAQYPRNVLAASTGSTKSNWTAAARPSLFVFLHEHTPSDELKALSQSFQGRLNFNVVDKTDKTLQRLFRVRSTPAYVFCAPALLSETNRTGVLHCATYDHAALGSNVPSVSKFLVQFVRDVAPPTAASTSAAAELLASVTSKYNFRPFILDASLASASEAAPSAVPSTVPAASLPPPIASAADFHSHCTDTAAGACLLLFHASTKPQPLLTLLSDLSAWNEQHAKRASLTVSSVVLPASSRLAAALVDEHGVLIDNSPSASGVSLLALLPKRNRAVLPPLELSSARDDEFTGIALDWIEAIVRDAKHARGTKVPRMQERMRELLANAQGDEWFSATDLGQESGPPSSSPPVEADPSASHDEL